MVLQEDMLAELKPSIHRIIKKQLGFSEETLLSESLTSLQHGADKDELTRKFFFLKSNLAIRNGFIRNKLVLRNHFL